MVTGILSGVQKNTDARVWRLRGPTMMECISDFNCLQTIAQLAPIGTALIALGAAGIALGAIWTQMYIATPSTASRSTRS
jgi:hypothetical protein